MEKTPTIADALAYAAFWLITAAIAAGCGAGFALAGRLAGLGN